MSWTVTTTTKVFPTDTPDVTPANDDRIMFSDTSDGGKIKDASIDQIFSSPWPKTFTAVEMIHDVTSNTEAPNMRKAVKRTKVKNIWDAWGVEFVEYVDADNSIVWFRKRALRGYLRKRVDWTIASFNDLLIIEYDTYDWDVTYTNRTSIKTNSLYFNDQNRTGERTSYTPTVSGTSWTVWSVSWAWRYKLIGKTCHCIISLAITKWTLSWRIYFSLPVNSKNNNEEPVSCIFWVAWTTPATSYWYATPWWNGWTSLEMLANLWSAWSWASISSSTVYLKASFTYETI